MEKLITLLMHAAMFIYEMYYVCDTHYTSTISFTYICQARLQSNIGIRNLHDGQECVAFVVQSLLITRLLYEKKIKSMNSEIILGS